MDKMGLYGWITDYRIKRLVARLNNPEGRADAVKKLERIGGAVIPYLTDLLGSDDPETRQSAVSAITSIAYSVSDPDLLLRDAVVPLIGLVRSDEKLWEGCSGAISKILGRYGSTGGILETAVPLLVDLMEDEDQTIRPRAVHVFGEIAGFRREDSAILVDAMPALFAVSQDIGVEEPATALAKIGSQGLPYLIEQLGDEKNRLLAAHVISIGVYVGLIQKDCVEAIGPLVDMLGCDDLELRSYSMAALWGITEGNPEKERIMENALVERLGFEMEESKVFIALMKIADYPERKDPSALDEAFTVLGSRLLQTADKIERETPLDDKRIRPPKRRIRVVHGKQKGPRDKKLMN